MLQCYQSIRQIPQKLPCNHESKLHTAFSRKRHVALTSFVFRTFSATQNIVDEQQQRKDSNQSNVTRWQSSRWDIMRKQLIEYRETYGDTLCSSEHKDYAKLGKWVDNQRQQYRKFILGEKSLLNEERVSQLEQEGFVWDAHALVWDQNYQKLVKYKNEFGDCDVPKSAKELESLWIWVITQRQLYAKRYNKKQKNSMTDERIEALEAIGFKWSIPHDENWNLHFEDLKKYRAYHGDCLVPLKNFSNQKLSNWVDMQRTQYRLLNNCEPSSLNEERVAELESIGFVWNVNDYKWNRRYAELEAFKVMNGHLRIPSKNSLSGWYRRQQKLLRKYVEGGKSIINEERKKKLLKIGLIPGVRDV